MCSEQRPITLKFSVFPCWVFLPFLKTLVYFHEPCVLGDSDCTLQLLHQRETARAADRPLNPTSFFHPGVSDVVSSLILGLGLEIVSLASWIGAEQGYSTVAPYVVPLRSPQSVTVEFLVSSFTSLSSSSLLSERPSIWFYAQTENQTRKLSYT